MKHVRFYETLRMPRTLFLQDSYDKAVAGVEADTIRGSRKVRLR